MFDIPETICTRTLLCGGVEELIEVRSIPGVSQRATSGGTIFGYSCEYIRRNAKNQVLQVFVDHMSVRDELLKELKEWLPAAGFWAVRSVLCGILPKPRDGVIPLRTPNDFVDPQREDMSAFRRRCRMDILREMQFNLFLPVPYNLHEINFAEIMHSNRLSRIYHSNDVLSALNYWESKGFLARSPIDESLTIDDTQDEEIAKLMSAYNWEESVDVAEELTTQSGTEDEQPSLLFSPSGPSVFICHSKGDAAEAEQLYHFLKRAGANPWLDKVNLVHGDLWEREIKKAVARAAAFVVCLRPGFDEIGFRQKEVRLAIDALQLRPLDRGFIIPFIIEPCRLPDWCKDIHAGSDLTRPTTDEELLRAIEKHCGWKRNSAVAT